MFQPWPENRDPWQGAPAGLVRYIDADANNKIDGDDDDDTSIANVVGKGEKIPVPGAPTVTVTQSGRVSRPPACLLNKYEFGGQSLDAKPGHDRKAYH
eukprot:4440812-Ditylum_brightwellii.AAC.1